MVNVSVGTEKALLLTLRERLRAGNYLIVVYVFICINELAEMLGFASLVVQRREAPRRAAG